MSKQNKWKQIPPSVGHVYTISNDDMAKLSDLVPNKQSDIIDDLTDLGTYVYYNLINMTNALQEQCHAIKSIVSGLIQKAPEHKDELIKVFNITADMFNTANKAYENIKDKLPEEEPSISPREQRVEQAIKDLDDSASLYKGYDGRIYASPKGMSEGTLGAILDTGNDPFAIERTNGLAGEKTPEEDALISQAIKNAVQGVM